jgi:hypothetical protein
VGGAHALHLGGHEVLQWEALAPYKVDAFVQTNVLSIRSYMVSVGGVDASHASPKALVQLSRPLENTVAAGFTVQNKNHQK